MTKISWKITYLKFHWNLPGANELIACMLMAGHACSNTISRHGIYHTFYISNVTVYMQIFLDNFQSGRMGRRIWIHTIRQRSIQFVTRYHVEWHWSFLRNKIWSHHTMHDSWRFGTNHTICNKLLHKRAKQWSFLEHKEITDTQIWMDKQTDGNFHQRCH